MTGALKRVLRIRALREDLSRMEAEAEAARLREIDLEAAEAGREARASREQAFWSVQGHAGKDGFGAQDGEAAAERAGWADSGGGQIWDRANRRAEGWRRAEAAWAAAVSRQSGWEGRRPAQQARVERAKENFMADRRDRLQAETLVEEAAARERADQARRDQRQLDDWFQSRAKRARNEAKG